MSVRRWVVVGVIVLLGSVLWASGRMIQLAFESAPGCVPHAMSETDGEQSFRAAKSSC